MKIAFCLHGVVGNLYFNKNQRLWTQDIDYRIGLEHYQKHLFNVNKNIDVFIHSWSTKYAEQLNNAYQPKKSLFQEQIDFQQSQKKLNFLKSRWYSTKAVVELKKAYEEDNGFVYDWVMLSRFDLALLSDLNFSNYDNKLFYAARHAYVAERPGQPEPSQTNNGFCDLFFFANSNNIDKFSKLYDVWDEYGICDAHGEAYFHAKQLGFSIAHDLLRGKDFELVRGIYEDCYYAGDAYPGIDKLKKCEIFPVDKF